MNKNLPCYYYFYGLLFKVCLCFICIVSLSGFAQSKDKVYSFKWKQATLLTAFKQIEKEANVHFSYNPLDLDETAKINLTADKWKINQVLDAISQQIDIRYQINGETIMVRSNKDKPVSRREFNLSGKVTDAGNSPMPGVAVSNKATGKNTMTNGDGLFTITASKGDVIHFKMIGFQLVSITANDLDKNINVVLKEEVTELREAVVTALGIKREERSLGYAVSQVDGEELKKARETNVINSLAGKVPGLIINSTAGGPAGSSRVIIRGNTSITGNNQPLYVVDGIPMDNSNYGQAGGKDNPGGVDFGDAISAINPDDVDKISILKGPSASALYGSRAANGVVLITMKKGKGDKGLGIEFNSTSTLENQLTTFDGYQTQYGQGNNQLLNLTPDQARTSLRQNFGPKIDPGLMTASFDGIDRPYALVKDNISNFFRTGSTFTNTISFSNSNDISSFRLSASDLRNNDIVPESKMRRNSFTFNGTSKFGAKLTMEARAFYMNENVNNRPALADDASNIGNSFIGLANTLDQSMFKNAYKTATGDYLEWGGGVYNINPYWIINEMKNTTSKNRFMGSIQLNYNILDWLNLQGRVATDQMDMDYQKFAPPSTPRSITGQLDLLDRNFTTTEADVLLTAQKQVTKDLHLSARLGGSISRVSNKGEAMTFTNMTVRDVVTPNSFADKSIIPTHYRKHLNSVYGLLSAGYKSYLYLDASVRQDASSTLPVQNNSYTYPSVATSFVFSDAFKIDNSILSFGKLRLSAAEVGNDTDPYQLDLYYGLNPLSFNGGSQGGISGDILPNKNLKPTRTRSYEMGTELRFLGNRIGLDVTVYTQKSRDQINKVPAPISSGFAYQIVNAGVISNKGIEVMLNTKPIVGRDFNWDLSVNFARNVNQVESLADGIPYLSLSDARWLGVSIVAMPGAAYGSILAYKEQRDPNGNVILDPEKSLTPKRNTYREVIGKGTYSWTGGMSSVMNYKNFGLNFVVDVKQGADLFSMTNLFAAVRGSLNTTLEGREEWIKSEEERLTAGKTFAQWTADGKVRGYVPKGVVKTGTDENPIYVENTQAVDPALYWGYVYPSDSGVGKPYVYDATYVKMREITLSYRVPASFSSRLGLKDIQVAVVSRNPFIIYKNVPNVDPDSNYSNGNGQGLEYGSLPTRRSWGFNLNFRF
ncbi:SusC/RagA family TonB-linked outer membrane protein [Pedobacter polysacchareus]|uniref:SusC/RagA family TonB-linked outer membrane protein n=1 Tax=Pedobacter polysacchareus TaxID=2861973 RepID=UPI001C9976DE|nr:SusC/RagA family TonB-linked outer membrane protein [Pedobacter polysacchareus]